MRAMLAKLALVLPTDLEAVGEFVEEAARRMGIDEADGNLGFRFRMGVTEALVNAMKHGNRKDAAKSVLMELWRSDSSIRVKVRDEGSGFAPETVPDPTGAKMLRAHHGRGIFLMRELCDEVSYNEKGNEVVLKLRVRSD